MEMFDVLILLALSVLLGFALGNFFSCYAVLTSSLALAVLSAAVLQIKDFGALSGIAIITCCLTVHQLAYLMGATRAKSGPTEGEKKSPADARGWGELH
jgi:hypothetical protein